MLLWVTQDATGATLRSYEASSGAPIDTLAVPGVGDPVVANGRVYLAVGNVLHAYALA